MKHEDVRVGMNVIYHLDDVRTLKAKVSNITSKRVVIRVTRAPAGVPLLIKGHRNTLAKNLSKDE